MNKQDEYSALMEMIHRHYSTKEIEEFKSYSNMGVKETPQATITVQTNTYGN